MQQLLCRCGLLRQLPHSWINLNPIQRGGGGALQEPSSRLLRRSFGTLYPTLPRPLPLKPGTLIPGLDIYKEKEAPVALERDEYPEWLESLTRPLPSLAMLRRMPEEEATDREKKRYLKLTRRMKIKKHNAESAGQKR